MFDKVKTNKGKRGAPVKPKLKIIFSFKFLNILVEIIHWDALKTSFVLESLEKPILT